MRLQQSSHMKDKKVCNLNYPPSNHHHNGNLVKMLQLLHDVFKSQKNCYILDVVFGQDGMIKILVSNLTDAGKAMNLSIQI